MMALGRQMKGRPGSGSRRRPSLSSVPSKRSSLHPTIGSVCLLLLALPCLPPLVCPPLFAFPCLPSPVRIPLFAFPCLPSRFRTAGSLCPPRTPAPFPPSLVPIPTLASCVSSSCSETEALLFVLNLKFHLGYASTISPIRGGRDSNAADLPSVARARSPWGPGEPEEARACGAMLETSSSLWPAISADDAEMVQLQQEPPAQQAARLPSSPAQHSPVTPGATACIILTSPFDLHRCQLSCSISPPLPPPLPSSLPPPASPSPLPLRSLLPRCVCVVWTCMFLLVKPIQVAHPSNILQRCSDVSLGTCNACAKAVPCTCNDVEFGVPRRTIYAC